MALRAGAQKRAKGIQKEKRKKKGVPMRRINAAALDGVGDPFN